MKRCRYCCNEEACLWEGLCSRCHRNRTEALEVRPTRALPGTEEKVLVLAERWEAGQPLWHEDDNVGDGDNDDLWQGVVVPQRLDNGRTRGDRFEKRVHRVAQQSCGSGI